MANIQAAAQQVRAALDKIIQVKDKADQVRAAAEEAKTKLDQLVQQAGEGDR